MSAELDRMAEDLEELLPTILRQIYSGEEEGAIGELPLMQLRVVRCLVNGPRTMSSLGAELQMSGSRLAHLVSRLEDSGIVVREDDPSDRRVRIATLTPEGQKLLSARKRHRAARLVKVLARLNDSQRSELYNSLQNLLEVSRPATTLA
jgi:DNA-binding MarR family transcriptional regulator